MPGRLQINCEFITSEDRLLFKISEEGAKGCIEYRFWLTRRFLIIFLRAIDNLLEDDSVSEMQVSPEALDAMKKFKEEAALAKADFSTSYEGGSEDCTLFGEEPFLANQLKVRRKSKGKYVMGLFSKDKTGINLSVNIDLAHTLRKLLLNAARKAAWDRPFTDGDKSLSATAGKGRLDS